METVCVGDNFETLVTDLRSHRTGRLIAEIFKFIRCASEKSIIAC